MLSFSLFSLNFEYKLLVVMVSINFVTAFFVINDSCLYIYCLFKKVLGSFD